MFQTRLPISILKIIYGVAVFTENSSWATKHSAWLAENSALVAEKVAEVAENVAYYAKAGAESLEKKARETKEEYQQAIYKEEFRQINQEIIQGSEKFNPQLEEKVDAELADWIILEKEDAFFDAVES